MIKTSKGRLPTVRIGGVNVRALTYDTDWSIIVLNVFRWFFYLQINGIGHADPSQGVNESTKNTVPGG